MPVYDLKDPEDMIKLLQEMTPAHARGYWRWIVKNRGYWKWNEDKKYDDFMDKIREIVSEN